MKLDFDIKLGKWALFSILVIVILCGSYYSLFGLREGFDSGTCLKGCAQHPEGEVDGDCTKYNVEDGYNKFDIIDSTGTSLSLTLNPGDYTGKTLAAEIQRVISGSGVKSTSNFTATFHDPDDSTGKDMYLNQIEFNLNVKDDSETLAAQSSGKTADTCSTLTGLKKIACEASEKIRQAEASRALSKAVADDKKDSDSETLTIDFDPDKKLISHESSLASLFKTRLIKLAGSKSAYTPLDLTPWFPSDLVSTSICPQVCEGGVSTDKGYCKYNIDCRGCETVVCPQGNCPTPPNPSPSPSKKGGGGGGRGGGGGDGGGGGRGDGRGGGGGGGGRGGGGGGGGRGGGGRGDGRGDGRGRGGGGDNKPDCSQAKCYAQPLAGTNDQFNQFDPYNPKDPGNPKYDEDVGFCGISSTDENGMKFMFGCNSTKSCTKNNLDCNTECKRKDGKIIGNCQEYPCTKGVNWNKKDCAMKNPGKSDPGSKGKGKGDNSSNNYYDNDMDDYMNELMKPGQMTPNQMYNSRQARYGCDASQYGCCDDGFTFRKDASGNNCFDFLPYYNPILFRGGA
jgi:hypothetical protein